jgi:threonine/homoserine/homoserine lactone efflux protein
MATTSATLSALGIGLALAGAPGPVQAVLLTEAAKGGIPRGLRALAGVHLTFGALLVCLALGVSLAAPHGLALRLLKVAGGAMLVWLAADGLRSTAQPKPGANHRRHTAPAVRGVLAILLNPGGWLFLAAVASPLLATAAARGGMGRSLLAAGALVVGAALGDAGVVALGGLGLHAATEQLARRIRIALGLLLGGLGVWLVLGGLRPTAPP